MATCTYSLDGLEQMYEELGAAKDEMKNTLEQAQEALEKSEQDLKDAETELEEAEAALEEAEAALADAEAALSEAEATLASTPSTIDVEEEYTTTNDKGETVTETRVVTKSNPAYVDAQKAVASAQAAVNSAKKAAQSAKVKVDGTKKKVQGLKVTIRDFKNTIEVIEQSIKDTTTYMKAVKQIINTANKADVDAEELLITVNWTSGTFKVGNTTYISSYDISSTMYEGGLFGAEYFATIAEGCALEVKDGFHFYTIKIGDNVVQFPLEALSPTGNLDDIPTGLTDKAIIDKIQSVDVMMGVNGQSAVQRLMADLGMSVESYEHYLFHNSYDREKYQNMSESELQELLDTYSEKLEHSARANDWTSDSSWVNLSHTENNVTNYSGLDPSVISQLPTSAGTSECYSYAFWACISSYLGYAWSGSFFGGGSYNAGGHTFSIEHTGGNRTAYYEDGIEARIDELTQRDDVVGIMFHYWSTDGNQHWVVVQDWTGDIHTSTYYDPWYGEVRTYDDMTFDNKDDVFEAEPITVS